MQRLVVVADNSLIVEAIAIGIRRSGHFNFLGHVDGRTVSIRAIVETLPDVVLVDDMGNSAEAVELVRQIKSEDERIAVIALATVMAPPWLDAVFDAGASGAISKATHPAALATLLGETISGRVLHLHKRAGRVGGGEPQPVGAECASLTTRELEVLHLVAGGSTNGEIARQLWVTEQTVKFHLSNVYRKLDVGNRTQASHYAHTNGLVAPAAAADRPHADRQLDGACSGTVDRGPAEPAGTV